MGNIIKRWEDGEFRWYLEDGLKHAYPSVTTVLDIVTPSELKAWFKRTDEATIERISKRSADVGTEIHQLLEDRASGKEIIIPSNLTSLMNKHLEYIKKFTSYKPLHTELTVRHDKYGYAGTVDLVVEVDGKVEVWDYKTGRVGIKAGWQMGAYKLALEDCYGMKIDGMRVISINPKLDKVEDYVYSHFDYCIGSFLHSLELWKALYFNRLVKGCEDPDDDKLVYKWSIEQITFDCLMDFKQRRSNESNSASQDR